MTFTIKHIGFDVFESKEPVLSLLCLRISEKKISVNLKTETDKNSVSNFCCVLAKGLQRKEV